MDPLQFVIMSLATWRVASLISNEQGPFYVFERIRSWAGECYTPEGKRIALTMIGKLLICLECVSVWAGIFWFALWYFFNPLWVLSIPFALSAVAIAIEERVVK